MIRIIGVVTFSLILIMLCIVFYNVAYAESRVIRDSYGQRIGTIRDDPLSPNKEIIRDKYERPVGTLTKEKDSKGTR